LAPFRYFFIKRISPVKAKNEKLEVMESVIKNNLDKAPKTGDWKYLSPGVDAEKCIGCGTCVLFCPEAAIRLRENKHPGKNKNSKGIASIDMDWCKGCGVCAVECPSRAIIMKKI